MGDGLPAGLEASLAEYPRPWVRVLVALGALILPERQPVLALIGRRDADDPERFTLLGDLARLSTDLAVAQPLLSLALIVEPGVWNAYLEQAPESRGKALLRESAIPLTDMSAERNHQRLAERLRNQAADHDLDRSISRLIGDGASSGWSTSSSPRVKL